MGFEYQKTIVMLNKLSLAILTQFILTLLLLSCKMTQKLFRRKSMNFQPLGNRILVERMEEASTTSTGIIIPDNAKEKPSQGKVVAVSDDVKNVANGDTVVFGKYSGNELTLDGSKYIVIDVDDVFGIVK